MTRPAVLLVGGGRMGGAMLAGWLAADLVDRVHLVEPAGPPASLDLRSSARLSTVGDPDSLPAELAPACIVFAVKPQVMAEVAPRYRRFAEAGALALSIAAGIRIARFADWLGFATPIVRAMPNTPAAIGRGITAAVANRQTDAPKRALAEALLSAVGEVAWLDDEALMDAVTAVSGSGPAYVFLLIEALTEAGRKAALPEDLAEKLARATVAGSGELARRSPQSAAELRASVTSPNGTTAAAIATLTREDAFQRLFDDAIAAATARSRELAG